ARKVLRSLSQREIESPRSLEEPEPSVNDEHRKPEKFYKPTINTKSKAVEVWERRSPSRTTILEKFYEVYRNARWKAADVSDGRSPPRTTIIGAPKRFGKSTPKRDWKPPKFDMATALREPRSSQARKVLRSLPQREIESRRSLEEPENSETDYHRNTETF
ncbi:hypothetical protein NPIL_687471, partial [Nephila pilipes]